jgi:hypothetical protein
MARVRGPLLSRDASGSLAGTLSFLPGPGLTRVRVASPRAFTRSATQIGHEAMYSFLVHEWQSVTTANKATWANAYRNDQITNFQKFIKYNLIRWTHYKAPSIFYPATETGSIGTFTSTTVTPGRHHVSFQWNSANLAMRWGSIIHRSPTNGFTPNKTNVVHVWVNHSAVTISFNDLDLTPGTYYYRLKHFTFAGFLSGAGIQFTEVVT